MLAALLLLGMLPLAVLPFVEGDTEEVEEGDVSLRVSGGDTGGDSGGDLLDSADPAGADLTDEILPEDGLPGDDLSEDGLTHTLDGTAGEHVIEDFEPGLDMVVMDLTMVEDPVVFDMSQTDDGAAVSFSVGAETTTTVVFEGLTEVPAGDIMLRVPDDTGEPMEVSLTDIGLMSAQDAADLAETDPDDATAVDPVDPEMPDTPGPEVDPGTTLDPMDPETPDEPGPDVADGTVLEPVDPNAEVLGPEGSLALRDLLERDSENLVGMGETLAVAAEDGVADIGLGAGDDVLDLPDDGLAGTGEGYLETSQTAPVVQSVDGVDVVDGGDGNDQITLGDGAGFAFGGQGEDTLTAGEGAAAMFGGAGDDVLAAGDGAAWLDGGQGNDLINGGAGDDTLEGGEHSGAQSTGDDSIDGGAGDDVIRGGYGADQLIGGAGDDVIDHLGRTEQRQIIEQHDFDWHTDDAADSLEGGDGDDTLIFDRHDVVSGGEGHDLFWLYHDGADGGDVADVADFRVGEDFLRVSLNPNIGENGEPDVQVEPSADGADGLVIVNGDLVAVLRGAPGATASDIYAEVSADVFA